MKEDAQLTGNISSLIKDQIVYIGKNNASEINNNKSLNETEKNQKDIESKEKTKQINELDNIIKKQETEIKEQKKKIEELEELFKQQETIIKKQNKQNEGLEKLLKQQETELKAQDIQKNEQGIQKYEKQLKEQEAENNELKNQIVQLKRQICTLQPSIPSFSHYNEMIILNSEMIHNLRIISDLGRGSAGKVVKVGKEELYAMKIMNLDEGNNFDIFKHFINEYELLNMLHHPNIIKVHGIFFGDETTAPSILKEYCPDNLDNIIKTKRINNYERAMFIYQIAEGFKYIHFKRIIHRDIKPQNILIGSDGLIKICDFGISKFVSNEDSSTMTIGIGTQKFMAPEIINEEKQYTEKVDVYSFGVLIFYILCGKMPEITIGKIANGIKAEIPDSVNEFGKKLINLCWSFEPQSRPSFNEICCMLKTANYEIVELNSKNKS